MYNKQIQRTGSCPPLISDVGSWRKLWHWRTKLAEYDEVLNDQLGISDGISWEQEFGHTGRKVRGNEGYALATEWAQLPDSSELSKHPADDEFRSLIPHAPSITSLLLCFRVHGITGKAPSSAEMGLLH